VDGYIRTLLLPVAVEDGGVYLSGTMERYVQAARPPVTASGLRRAMRVRGLRPQRVSVQGEQAGCNGEVRTATAAGRRRAARLLEKLMGEHGVMRRWVRD
jgi:hypothetical protein